MKKLLCVLLALLLLCGVVSADTLIVYPSTGTDGFTEYAEGSYTFTAITGFSANGLDDYSNLASIGVWASSNSQKYYHHLINKFDHPPSF